MLEDMPSWFRPKPVGLVVAALLLAIVVVMALTYGHHKPNGLDSEQPEQITAVATERLATYQLMTLFVGIPSLILLGWTFAETRRAARASVDAAMTTRAATRAYLFAEVDGPIDALQEDSNAFSIVIKNVGQSPARNVTLDVVQPKKLEEDWDLAQPWNLETSETRLFDRGAIGGGSEIRSPVALVAKYYLQERAKYGIPYYITVRGTYETVLSPGVDESFRLTFAYVRHGQAVETGNEFGWQIHEGEYDPRRARPIQ